ncbi:prolyl oligopeptidase family serine peptidase [Cohnella sp. CFH 77786]|uniref:carboxylesterase family protein n=1 Tax=Cohnella sp. CFH 77786 TaxID=2662265 RepID=UPI001C6092CC|nr:prolyl oligopeptidase family serine peptidase [Cohnella sp. CFH 77786]MBW5447876.1 prolyl oligopeptidase family serine peptidase [Cohnella sp. CFH 77786]
MTVQHRHFRQTITKRIDLGFQLFLPDEYETKTDRSWPLILFLHGVKKRGSDLRLLDGYGLPSIAENWNGFEFLVLAPQCPAYTDWTSERDAVLALLERILSDYRVDPDRIYLTGFSMGGHGAWDLAAYRPDRFAAVVPLAGWFDPEAAHLLGEMPVWAFHGEEDDMVPVQATKDMVQALKSADGNVTCTFYPGLKHFIMNETYRNPDLYAWLLEHRKREGC